MSQQAKHPGINIKPNLGGVERRDSDRIEVRRSEGIDAQLQTANQVWLLGLQVYDISLSGISLVIPLEHKSLIHPGEKFNVRINCSWGHKFEGEYTVNWITDHDQISFRVGMRS